MLIDGRLGFGERAFAVKLLGLADVADGEAFVYFLGLIRAEDLVNDREPPMKMRLLHRHGINLPKTVSNPRRTTKAISNTFHNAGRCELF
jgi:hypothetical protein